MKKLFKYFIIVGVLFITFHAANAFAANCFWVGGNGTWSAANAASWSVSSGGAGSTCLGAGGVPGAADTATLDGSSGGGTVTVGTGYNPSVTSLTMGAFTGTLDFSAFNNSPTMQTFSGTGSGTRTLNLGNGTWTITGASTTVWTIATSTNLTFNANSSVITVTGTAATFTGGGSLTYATVNLNGGGAMTLGTTTTFATLNINGVGAGDSISMAGSNTVSGTLTITGNSGANLMAMKSSTPGTARTMTMGNGSFTNASWADINITKNGAGTTWTLNEALNLTMTGAGTTVLTITNGNFTTANFAVTADRFNTNNSNTRVLTFGSSVFTLSGSNESVYVSGATGLTTSEGTSAFNLTYSGSTGTRTFNTGGSNINDMNVTAGSDIITLTSQINMHALNFTGFSGSWTSAQSRIRGDLTLGSAMTVTSGTGALLLSPTANNINLTTNGVQMNVPITVGSAGTDTFSVILADNLDMTGADNTRTMTVTSGTLNVNNKNASIPLFSSTNANTRTLTFGTGTVTLTGTGTVFTTATTTGLTVSATTGTIKVNDSSSSSKTFSGGGKTFGTLLFSGSGTGVLIIIGSNTFASITIDTPPHTINFTNGTTQTVTTTTWSGIQGNLNTLQSTSGGSAWTLIGPTGVNLCSDYISLQDSAATTANWYAGAHSTNVSNNTGWQFRNCAGPVSKVIIY